MLIIPGRPVNTTETAERATLLAVTQLTTPALLRGNLIPSSRAKIQPTLQYIHSAFIEEKRWGEVLGGNHYLRVIPLNFYEGEASLLVNPSASGRSVPAVCSVHPAPTLVSWLGKEGIAGQGRGGARRIRSIKKHGLLASLKF